MRALFFLNSLHGGGTEKVCLNLAKRLYELNIESDFVTVFNKESDYSIPDYIDVFTVGLKEPLLTRLPMIRSIFKVNQFISGKEYVLITAHLNPAQNLASLTKVKEKTLYVMHVPQYLADKNNSQRFRKNLRNFYQGKKLITVSNGLQNELYYKYGIARKDIRTIYNPCDVKNLRSKEKTISPGRKPYFLFMGRLEEEKNPHMALELYYKGCFYKNYDLIYLGKGSLELSLRKRITEIGMEDHVFIAGFQKEPAQWLLNASLLLSCSRQEGFALNIAEALICGIPVVAADCPYGPREILIDELSEYLIDPEAEFDKSISVIASALKRYPEITEKYYGKFDDAVVLQNYLEAWRKWF